jgi:hypothetical protein
VNVGVVPVIDGDAGVADGVQKRMASSNVWSAMTNASSGDGERRPETETASSVDGAHVALQKSDNSKHQEMRQRERRGTV